ncbi:adenosine 3'-phospho 5'-phosphosulfate transporter 1 [Anthonomus grandis grandis]|uniref:adenosine 3'-phospho 5'-phosphosulfate transporter 1 n=1 Tax=Anthonomus grandis grandis TaxID=2921223 RepID=UPI002165154A|nr:adenosine 3'-phospho 5'-phosphosulfate transporter 1 [Anthonomus grandis grandis]
MAKRIELGIFLIIFFTVFFLSVINLLIINLEVVQNPPANSAWLIHAIRNTAGYLTVFLPGYLIFKYIKTTNYLSVSGRGPIGAIIRTCFSEDDLLLSTNPKHEPTNNRTPLGNALLLLFYFFGLQLSYLSWGVLQEKVMTQKYVTANGDIAYFKDSQFLVFVNRILAFAMSALLILCSRQPRHRCPLYKYAFCSFSNIMSSWCQYEALKYVSFPHQVLAKASKTIPVMIMGKVVSRTKYEFYEYVTAGILSVGMLFFMLDSGNDRANSTATTFSGAVLLISYIVFDSFTSNWQSKLFKTYEMKPIQMMCFVNFFSGIFTFVSLLQHGGLIESIRFMFTYPQFVADVVIISICSASGQLFIYNTIDDFGPLVFVIISTIRQCLSVLLSCIIYGHVVHVMGGIGLFLVFFSILLKIYCGQRIRKIKQQSASLLKS